MNRRVALAVSIALVAGGISVAVISQAGASPKPPAAVAADSPPADLYVANTTCGATADGSISAPFCTISAAEAVAQPGQTVYIEPGTAYDTRVNFTHSGAPGHPITFIAEHLPGTDVVVGRITKQQPDGSPTVDFDNVHDIVIRGFVIDVNADKTAVVDIDDSSDITIDGGSVDSINSTYPAIEISGSSDNVTISRNFFTLDADGIDVSGATHVDIAANQFETLPPVAGTASIKVTDAPGVDVVNNTLWSACRTAIMLAGDSDNASIENNVIEPANTPFNTPTACPSGTPAATSVSAGSTSGTVDDYNLTDPISGAALYAWGDSTYTALPAFRTATAQGAHDLTAGINPGTLLGDAGLPYRELPATAALDSADENARGALPTDLLGNAHEDDATVTNTGTGNGYADRGAVEYAPTNGNPAYSLSRKPGGGPLDLVASVPLHRSWPTDGASGTAEYQIPGQAFPVISTAASIDVTAPKGGPTCIHEFWSPDGFRTAHWVQSPTYAVCAVAGSDYTPLSAKRVLDTRNAIGVNTRTPVAARATITLPVSTITNVPLAGLTAIVMNVTATGPTKAGFLTVYSGSTKPDTSNVNFVAGQSVPNLVTLPVVDGNVNFYNGSDGTVQLIADFVGYYGPGGSGFKPMTAPVRVLDTRHHVGVSTTAPVSAGGTVNLDVSTDVPSGATAAVLNVTATGGTLTGFVTVYPAGQALPNASNLNYAPGQTIANLVIVPVTNGKISLTNTSTGTVQLIADLSGFYGNTASGATQTFVPSGPLRIADTRPQGQAANSFRLVIPQQIITSGSASPAAASVVYNVTAVTPASSGWLTAYPSNHSRPDVSNLNFAAGRTVPNLVIVANTPYVAIFNDSPGATNILVDEEGYFIAAA